MGLSWKVHKKMFILLEGTHINATSDLEKKVGTRRRKRWMAF